MHKQAKQAINKYIKNQFMLWKISHSPCTEKVNPGNTCLNKNINTLQATIFLKQFNATKIAVYELSQVVERVKDKPIPDGGSKFRPR